MIVIKKYFIVFITLYLIIFTTPVIITFLSGNANLIYETKTKNLDSYLKEFKLYYIEDSREVPIHLEDYIIGVLAKEMSVNFETEALKAQAVASRTYAIRHINENEKNNIRNIGQDYMTITQMQDSFGSNFNSYYNKIKKAVESTKGEVIYYDNEPIDAVFHSTSAGLTENSKDVWSVDLPYLVSVDSSQDENAADFICETEFDQTALKNIFKRNYVDINLGKDELINEISIIETTAGGYVTKIRVGDIEFSGQEIRTLLNLRSTNFTVRKSGSNIIFTTKGYGHGVGMSQNGANFLAKQGFNYKQILNHYYSLVVIKTIYEQ